MVLLTLEVGDDGNSVLGDASGLGDILFLGLQTQPTRRNTAIDVVSQMYLALCTPPLCTVEGTLVEGSTVHCTPQPSLSPACRWKAHSINKAFRGLHQAMPTVEAESHQLTRQSAGCATKLQNKRVLPRRQQQPPGQGTQRHWMQRQGGSSSRDTAKWCNIFWTHLHKSGVLSLLSDLDEGIIVSAL
jgi:hypothetical protein